MLIENMEMRKKFMVEGKY